MLQKDFVTDDHGKIIVDFVGRFEKLQADFQTICKQLNLVTKLPHANRNLDVKKPYKDYYNKETQQMVAAYFQEDIEFFNYSFPD
ncbi:MAG: hypothetical protein SAK42_00005 [Oscillatoria sp. PMC 1076.18]|nr:hypothetical protein [Oscillatoria sp. PMC 1076.18]